MAVIYYVDFVSGDNANDGLTTSTPKKDFGGFSAISWTSGDEVKVLGIAMTALSEDLAWVKGSNTITTITDLTSEISVGDYITKTGDPLKIYEVSSITSSLITLFTYWGGDRYAYDTETVGSSKLNTYVSTASAEMLMNKNGFSTSDRTKITGGWDATYTSQDKYSYLDGNALGIPIGDYDYYHINKIVFLNFYAIKFDNCNLDDSFVGHGHNGKHMFSDTVGNTITNCSFIGSDYHWGYNINSCTVTNCNIASLKTSMLYVAVNNVWSGVTIDYLFGHGMDNCNGPNSFYYCDFNVINYDIFKGCKSLYCENMSVTACPLLVWEVTGFKAYNLTLNSSMYFKNSSDIYINGLSGTPLSSIQNNAGVEIYYDDTLTSLPTPTFNSPAQSAYYESQSSVVKYTSGGNVTTDASNPYSGVTNIRIFGGSVNNNGSSIGGLVKLPITPGVDNDISFYLNSDGNFTGNFAVNFINIGLGSAFETLTVPVSYTQQTISIAADDAVFDYVTIQFKVEPTTASNWNIYLDNFTVSV